MATIIINGQAARDKLKHWADRVPVNTVVRMTKAKRSVSQNARMWAMLSDISEQTKLRGEVKTTDQWKGIFMFERGHEIAFEQSINGEFFPVGLSTSKLNKEQMGDLMESISAYGAENGVVFQEPVE